MKPEALLAAGPVVISHTLLALVALVVGALQLYRQKGSRTHLYLGRFWVGLMACVALTSFAIFEIQLWGPFSPIHLLSLFTLITCVTIVRTARAGQIKRHRVAVISLYVGGLVLAGAFTLAPGRIMHSVVFGV